MEFRGRKLIAEAVNTTDSDTIRAFCKPYCDPLNSSRYCPSSCKIFCSDICTNDFPNLFPPPSPVTFTSNRSPPLNQFLIVLIVVISVCFLGVCCYTVYARYFANRRRSQPPEEEDQETHDEFLDEDHGPGVYHHVWYINTIGLQPSVISAIMVCKYKRDEGLVEGTECSVCLNEFQEDETLRLLPKCSHAFHISCIDTWLRSHTNCPMCRAPIVNNTAEASSSSSSSAINIGNSGTGEDGVQNRILESNEGSDTEMEGEAGENELAVENGRKRDEILDEEVGKELQWIRRSFSMDSLSALKIIPNLAANVPSMEPNRNSDARMMKANKSGRGSSSQRIVGDLSLLRAMSGSSSVKSSQDGSSLMQRSLSCYGKLLLPASCQNRNRNQNSILPL